MTTQTTTPACAACGAPVTGRFCAACGAAAGPANCTRCQAPVTPGARFCPRCGQPAAGAAPRTAAPATPAPAPAAPDRTPWLIAGVAGVAAVAALIYAVAGKSPPPPPPAAAAPAASGGAPPDLSAMTPRERFDRLFNRIMSAASNGDTATVVQFTPMGLTAYAQLDPAEVDADARYHAALLHAQVGEWKAAQALADTILQKNPGHLFGYLVRGEVATLTGDKAALARAHTEFLGHYDAEIRAKRPEYDDHEPVLSEFRKLAMEGGTVRQ